jgi:hypothetical protein
MITIKDLADELGVSKEKVKYLTRKLPDDSLVKTKIPHLITDEGVAIIKGLLAVKSGENSPEINQLITDKDTLIQSLQDEIAFLRNALLREQELNLVQLKKLPQPSPQPPPTVGVLGRIWKAIKEK